MAADATCAPGPGETACANPDPHISAMTLHRILILDIRSSPGPAIKGINILRSSAYPKIAQLDGKHI